MDTSEPLQEIVEALVNVFETPVTNSVRACHALGMVKLLSLNLLKGDKTEEASF